MSDHDLILLATKHGSWFGNTLELRKEGLVALAKELYRQGFEAGVAASEADWKDK